jgi:alcohol dehydrogenase class IV
MRALDHAVEGSYSMRHQLVTDTLASKAIALLNAHLLPRNLARSVRSGFNREIFLCRWS